MPIECYLHTVGREIIQQTAGDCDISSLSLIQDDERYLSEVWKKQGFQALGKQNYEIYRKGIITLCRDLQNYDLKHLGIRCFTDKKNNPKMWDEYASHAQGVCLYIPTEPLVKEYRDGVRVASPLDFIFPVYYSDSERECLKSEICNKPPAELTSNILTKYNQLCTLTKLEQYSDESEWRFVMGFYPSIPYDADIDETSRLRYLNHEMTFPIVAIELGSNISPIMLLFTARVSMMRLNLSKQLVQNLIIPKIVQKFQIIMGSLQLAMPLFINQIVHDPTEPDQSIPVYCPKCNTKIENGALFCSNCGCRLAEILNHKAPAYCPYCGTKVDNADAMFCSNCGKKLA